MIEISTVFDMARLALHVDTIGLFSKLTSMLLQLYLLFLLVQQQLLF